MTTGWHSVIEQVDKGPRDALCGRGLRGKYPPPADGRGGPGQRIRRWFIARVWKRWDKVSWAVADEIDHSRRKNVRYKI